MSIINRLISTLVWIWRLTELAAKVAEAEEDIIAMDGRIDARMDKSWKDLDARMDSEEARATADRASLKEEVAYLQGTVDEINRKRHGVR